MAGPSSTSSTKGPTRLLLGLLLGLLLLLLLLPPFLLLLLLLLLSKRRARAQNLAKPQERLAGGCSAKQRLAHARDATTAPTATGVPEASGVPRVPDAAR
jgi:hypothetical protein